MVDAGLGELDAGLADQLTAVDEDQHMAAPGCGGLGDGAEDDSLAHAGGRDEQGRPNAGAEGEAQIRDGLLLVRT